MIAAVLFLAEDAPLDPTTGKGPEWGKAAPIALLIILLMGVALFLLIRSMNRQLKKVPSDFMRGAQAAVPATGSAPGDATGTATGDGAAGTSAEGTAARVDVAIPPSSSSGVEETDTATRS